MKWLYLASIIVIFHILTPVDLIASELKTEVAKIREVEDLRQFDGIVEAVNRSTISAQTSGRIVELNFDVDDFVRVGSVIVRFSDVEQKTRLARADAQLMAAIAARKGAEEDFKRVEKLLKNATVSRARFDDAKAVSDAAKAQEASAKAAVDQAREQLAYTIVKAPYSGIVVERHVQIGEVASPGQPLMTGFSLDKLRVRVTVPQQIANIVRKENTAFIFDDAGNTINAARLTVFPFADAKSNTVTIRAELPEGTNTVFPGMLVKIAFRIGTTKSLTIPVNALIRRGEVIGVYIVGKNDALYLQQIRIGRTFKNEVEVLSGLETGDQIAIHPLKATLLLKTQSGKTDE